MDASKLVDLIFNHHAVWRDRSPTEQITLSAGNQIKNIKTRFYLTFKILTKRRTGRTRRTFNRTFGLGLIDVGDECWRQNVLIMGFPSPTSTIFLHKQHSKHVINIEFLSPTSRNFHRL